MNDIDHAEQAERDVIGAILLNPDSLKFAIEHITGDDFANRRLGAAYSIMVGHRGSGYDITETAIAKGMTERGYKTRPVDLFDLKATVHTAANVDYVARMVADAAGKRRALAFGVRMAQMAQSDAAYPDVMQAMRVEWQSLTTANVSNDATAPTLGEVLDGPDDYDWIIPGLLERQDRLVITGGEGAGKSYLTQQLAILSAAGIHPITFAEIDPIGVLVVDAENSEKQWRRRVRPLVRKAAQHGTIDPRHAMRVKTVPRLDITNEKDLGWVHRLLDEHTPDLLVIGPLYKLSPKAIQTDDDAAPLIAALDGLRARGCALVMEAHAGHGKGGDGERDLRPRGSSALLGWPEFGLGLRLDKSTEGTGAVEAELVRWRGDRDERAWPDRLRRGGEWPWSDATPGLTAWKHDQIAQSANRYAPTPAHANN